MAFRCPAVDFCASANTVHTARRRELSSPSSGISVVGEPFRIERVDVFEETVRRDERAPPLATRPGIVLSVVFDT